MLVRNYILCLTVVVALAGILAYFGFDRVLRHLRMTDVTSIHCEDLFRTKQTGSFLLEGCRVSVSEGVIVGTTDSVAGPGVPAKHIDDWGSAHFPLRLRLAEIGQPVDVVLETSDGNLKQELVELLKLSAEFSPGSMQKHLEGNQQKLCPEMDLYVEMASLPAQRELGKSMKLAQDAIVVRQRLIPPMWYGALLLAGSTSLLLLFAWMIVARKRLML